MSVEIRPADRLDPPTLGAAVRRRLLQVGLLVLVQAAVLFIAAGRLSWWESWAYIGLYLSFIALNALVMLPKGSALIEERGRIKAGAKSWDLAVGGLVTLLGPVMLAIAGLDERFTWTPAYGQTLPLAALFLMTLGYGLFSWAMASNRFFSSVVRIQKDRGHTVVTAGPYRFLRHPGYAGLIVFTLATPVLLGSLWALIPAGLMTALTVLRTFLEDRTLQNELPGYHDYTHRVRYRLVPGLW